MKNNRTCSSGFSLRRFRSRTKMLPRANARNSTARFRPTLETLEERCVLSTVVRSMDGMGNNMENPEWGAAGAQLLRLTSLAWYDDEFNSPGGADRHSARAISNAVLAQSESLPSESHLSAMVFQWGQFLDHDLDLTENATPAEEFPILVPTGDEFFDPTGEGGKTIGLNRSAYVYDASGIRQQVNAITAFIDASNVYGSDETRAAALRLGMGGRLKVTESLTGDLLPFNTDGLPNAGGTNPALFLAGDVRSNEQVGLTAMHTLFVREHNRLAGEIAAANPGWTDEEIYQRARKIVGAQIQVITYNEFLPAILGPNRLHPYKGYNSDVDPGISNIFSTAAFRVGHTMLPDQLLRLDNNGNVIPDGNLALADAFFRPDRITDEGGIEPILKGLAEQVQQEIDAHIVDAVRNFLFGPPGAGGFDLGSLNIQRGRDHGLPSYNQARIDFGLKPVQSFADISSDVNVQAALASVYADVNQVDVWVGGIAEDHMPGSNLGPLFTAIWVDQFQRARDGDWFWYENDPAFSKNEIAQLNATTLADIIRRNTGITNLQAQVFFQHQFHAHKHGGNKLTDMQDTTTQNIETKNSIDAASLSLLGLLTEDGETTSISVLPGEIDTVSGFHSSRASGDTNEPSGEDSKRTTGENSTNKSQGGAKFEEKVVINTTI